MTKSINATALANSDAAEDELSPVDIGHQVNDAGEEASPVDIGQQIDEAIEHFVSRYELPHTRDAYGGFEVPRSYEPGLGRGLIVHLGRRGAEASILQILVQTDRLTPAARWADMLQACNEWNTLQRWPKVYLVEGGPEAQGFQAGQLVCEASIDLTSGLNTAFLSDWINEMIGSSFDFWTWMTTEKGL